MNVHTQVTTIAGPIGAIDVSIDLPQNAPVRGLALVAHPHPLFAGTKDNKVAQTLARTFVALGYATVRPNFRGVGGTAGEHDKGIGEQDDTVPLASVLDWARPQELPVIVIPGADHFFHRKLHLIKQLVVNAWER